ncbi:hypothetical protein [Pseudomonas sp. B22129]|uniref:hypothetical protein n=1 Tax=Pseudomonas sp. B22129 TaxID=3235111 RepID=UPI003783C080
MSNLISREKEKINWNYLQAFPDLVSDKIARNDILGTISDVYGPENHVVFLEGESGIGATTVLAQFVVENLENTFSLFLSPASRYSYSIDYVKLRIAEQFKMFLDGVTSESFAVGDSEYTSLVFRVRGKLKGRIAYFVVDGLDHIPPEDDSYISEIFSSALPVGIDGFRFLISGSQSRLARFLNKSFSKTCQIRRFTSMEVDQLFAEFSFCENQLNDLKQLCRGNPGRMCAIKRQLKVGADLKEILESSPDKYLDFIALDFKGFDELNLEQKRAAAVLAFSKQTLTRNEVESISGASSGDVSELLESCTFLEAKELGLIVFVSNSHRKFAEHKLKSYQLEVADLQIAHLNKAPESDASLLFLASYLQQRNKHAELLELISNDHYYSLLESTQSISQLRGRAELGVESAQVIKDSGSVFKFSLQKALFIDLAGSSSSGTEVNALVAIGKTQHAMQLVGRALTKISKLSLLTAYATGLKAQSKNIDTFLVSQILELAKSIDFSEEGEIALQIAEDLVSIDMNLASEVLEKCLSNVNDLKHKDLTFSRFSIVASREQQGFAGNSFEGRIKNKAVQEFTSAITQFHKDESSADIISFFQSSRIKNKTRMLIHFVSTQTQREGLLDIVSYVLGVLDVDTDFVVTMKDLADLASPLKFQSADSGLRVRLVGDFDRQINLVKDKSAVREFVRFSTFIAYAEKEIDSSKAYDRLIDAYYLVCDSKDYEVISECFVRIYYALKYVDPDGRLESEHGLVDVVSDELKHSVDELLSNAASQYDCIESILPAIIEHDVSQAFDLAGRLNTTQNRYSAFQLIAEALVGKASSNEGRDVLLDIIEAITYRDFLWELLLSCTKILNDRTFDEGWGNIIRSAVGRIDNYSLAAKCKVNLFRYYAASESPMAPSYLVSAINLLIEKVSPTAARNEICFKAVEALSSVALEEAEKIYQRSTELRGTLEFENSSVQQNFMQCLALVVRSFGAALKSNALTAEMLSRVSASIGKLSSQRQQIALYTDLACRAWIADSMLKTIVSDYCNPLLEQARRNDECLYVGMFEIAFPALFVCHSESALKDLACLPRVLRNSALYNTCELIRRGQTATDPDPTDPSEEFPMDYPQASDIITLMEHMNYDSTIYQTLEKLVRSVLSKKNKSRFSSSQRKSLSLRLGQLVADKLPDPNNIVHKGYFICSMARVYMISEPSIIEWRALIDEAEKIPNEADKAFVYIEILSSMPAKLIDKKKELLGLAQASSNFISWLIDKLGRLELCALACKEFNVFSAKKMLSESFTMSHLLENIDAAADIQKSLIETADLIDAKFAEELIGLVDSDPARRGAQLYAKHSYDVVQAKKALADCNGTESSKTVPQEFLSEAAWRNLSSLLAGRITTKPLSALTMHMTATCGLGLGELYPLLCWYIENASRKYVSIEDVSHHIVPMCDVLLATAELAISVVDRRLYSSSTVLDYDSSIKGLIIRPNTRAAALEYIQNWLNQNCIEYIKLCDPYFSSEDMAVIQMIQAANPACKIHVLAVASHLKAKGCASNEEFELAWHNISDQTAPETYIYGVGKLDDQELIHDRWVISKGVGLRLGTSFNSIGYKISEISVMTPHELAECEMTLNNFLGDQVFVNGGRVKTTRYQL